MQLSFLVTVLATTYLKFYDIKIPKIILKVFFQVIIKNMAQEIELLTEKIQDVKIDDNIFFGKDLSFEQKFLNKIVKVCHEKIKDCEVSFHLSKRSMYI